jgi:creatinine amidohydrolase
MRRGGVAAVSELGVLGDPTTATAAEGERMLAEMVDDSLGRVRRWAPAADGMLT